MLRYYPFYGFTQKLEAIIVFNVTESDLKNIYRSKDQEYNESYYEDITPENVKEVLALADGPIKEVAMSNTFPVFEGELITNRSLIKEIFNALRLV